MIDNKILNKRYRIIDKIGSGGMAKVYQAQDLFLDRNVAIKVINLVTQIDDLAKQRFLQEIKAVTRVRHPNVILVYDIFIDKENWCLVLELMQGKTLKEYLNDSGVLSPSETLAIFQKILLGVNACHQVGIVHRDLKPDNVLLTSGGDIKILDFGISMIDGYEVKKHPHQVIGTMKYIAPEVVKFESPTIQSDVYSLGIMLYELLTGKAPFSHKNPQMLANKHIKDSIPSIHDINQNIPSSLENIIIKATNKDPAKRYSNILEMQLDLNSCLNESRKHERIITGDKKIVINKTKKIRIGDSKPFFAKKWFLGLLSVFIILIIALAIFVIIWFW